jgi:CHASE3 domain sensor protein
MEKKKLPFNQAIHKKSINGLAIGCVTLITVLAITLHIIISFFTDYWQ